MPHKDPQKKSAYAHARYIATREERKRARAAQLANETPEARERRLAAQRESYQKNKARILANGARSRANCREKIRARREADRELRQAWKKAWDARNVEKRRADKQAWDKANPDKKRTHDKAYRARHHEEKIQKDRDYYASHREEASISGAKRRAKNAEKIRQQKRDDYQRNPEVFKMRARRYQLEHPEAHRAAGRRRRAAKHNAPVNDLAAAQWQEIQAAQDHRCYYCGKRRKGKLTQDHLTPFAKSGSHTLHNVIAACRSCNSRKGTRPAPVPVQPLLLTLAPAKNKAS